MCQGARGAGARDVSWLQRVFLSTKYGARRRAPVVADGGPLFQTRLSRTDAGGLCERAAVGRGGADDERRGVHGARERLGHFQRDRNHRRHRPRRALAVRLVRAWVFDVEIRRVRHRGVNLDEREQASAGFDTGGNSGREGTGLRAQTRTES